MKDNLDPCCYRVQAINLYNYSCSMNIKSNVGFNEREKERDKAHRAITKILLETSPYLVKPATPSVCSKDQRD